MREEYREELIYDVITWIFLAAIGAGIAGFRLLYHTWGWWEGAGVIAGLAAVWYKCSKYEGDIWEWLDIIALPAFLGGTALTLIWGQKTEAIFFTAGVFITWLTKNTYRKWRWYKSGRPGVVGMSGIIWWGISQVAVAFLRPDKLYWGELTASQWVGSWILAAALVGLLFRSGRKLWPKFKTKKTTQ